MAGFVLSEDQIGRLCVEAWGVSQEMLENAGPFDCAYMYLGSRTNLNSPDFIEFWYKDPKTKRPTEAWMLPCRLAFVQPGATVPTLSFDAEAEAYIDHWFPPHIRASAAFESVKYAQVEYKGSCDCVSTLRSHWRFVCSLVPFEFSDPHPIERQITAYTPRGRLVLEEKLKKWLEYQRSEGREYSVIVRAPLFYLCPLLTSGAVASATPNTVYLRWLIAKISLVFGWV